MASNVRDVLEMVERIGNKETTTFLTNTPEGEHANEASIKALLSNLQAEQKRLRRTGPKGKENLENFLLKPFPFPVKVYKKKNPPRSLCLSSI